MPGEGKAFGWSGDVRISQHAQERFRERWKVLYGSSLLREDVLPLLRECLSRAQQTDHNLEHWVYGPWKFVFSSATLVTVMVDHQKPPVPVLKEDEIAHKFFLCIRETERKTFLARSAFADLRGAEEICLPEHVEARSVIHFLRMLGIQIHYHVKTRTEGLPEVVADVFFPHELHSYSVWQANAHVAMIHVGESLFKLLGLTAENRKTVRAFVGDEKWLAGLEQARLARTLEEEERERLEEEEKERKRQARVFSRHDKPHGKKKKTPRQEGKLSKEQLWANVRSKELPY